MTSGLVLCDSESLLPFIAWCNKVLYIQDGRKVSAEETRAVFLRETGTELPHAILTVCTVDNGTEAEGEGEGGEVTAWPAPPHLRRQTKAHSLAWRSALRRVCKPLCLTKET